MPWRMLSPEHKQTWKSLEMGDLQRVSGQPPKTRHSRTGLIAEGMRVGWCKAAWTKRRGEQPKTTRGRVAGGTRKNVNSDRCLALSKQNLQPDQGKPACHEMFLLASQRVSASVLFSPWFGLSLSSLAVNLSFYPPRWEVGIKC